MNRYLDEIYIKEMDEMREIHRGPQRLHRIPKQCSRKILTAEST